MEGFVAAAVVDDAMIVFESVMTGVLGFVISTSDLVVCSGALTTGFVVVGFCCCCCEDASPNPPKVGFGKVDDPAKGVAELKAVWPPEGLEKEVERPPAKDEDLWKEPENK